MIRSNGNYIAVKVPEFAYAFELQTIDMKSCYLYYWMGTMDYENEEVDVPFFSEIIGLISDIVAGDLTPELAGVVYEFTMDMMPTEWDQWLIIKKG